MNRRPPRQGTYEYSRRLADAPLGEVSLLRVYPDVAGRLAPEERGGAERALVAMLVRARCEDLAVALAAEPGDAFDVVAGRGDGVQSDHSGEGIGA